MKWRVWHEGGDALSEKGNGVQFWDPALWRYGIWLSDFGEGWTVTTQSHLKIHLKKKKSTLIFQNTLAIFPQNTVAQMAALQ